MTYKPRDFKPLLPLDAFILGAMQPEGTTFAGLYPLGETMISIVKKVSSKAGVKVSTSLIQGRIIALKVQGLCSGYPAASAGGTLTWQRTTKGEQALTDWTPTKGVSVDAV